MNFYWSNAVAWCVQITIIIGACAALPWLFRLRVSRARLWYWHVLLLICLALPLLQPWVKPAARTSEVTFTTGQVRLAQVPAPARMVIPWSMIAFTVLSSGIGLRLLWLGLGLIRLRRYRATALPLDQANERFTGMCLDIAPEAEILVSGSISSPVTFGFRDPVILLPGRFAGLSREERASIVCHELIHIRRHDWAVAIAEELVRSVLWFHPAIWWLLGQIQLTREQVVDQEVIGYTGDHARYLDALLAIASLRLSADLAPAPLFLKKHHLRQRVESIVSGVTMKKRNLILPLAAAFATLPVVIGIAAWQFPLRAAPQEAVDEAGVEVQLGAAKVLHRSGIPFPEEARAKQLSGTVVANVSVDDKGEVTGAHIVSGPDELGKPVIQSILGWHFSLDSAGAPRTFDIAVRFGDGQAQPRRKGSSLFPNNAPDEPRTVESISMSSLPAALRDKITQASLVHVGDVLTRENFKTIDAALRNIDDHLRITGALHDSKMAVIIRLTAPPPPMTYSTGALPQTLSNPQDSTTPIRVGGTVQSANLIEQVRPVYPPLAKQARIQGTVKFNAIIGADGLVKNLQVVSGHPMLVQAALEAVKQWVYKPTFFNGKPVDVITVIDVNFTLRDTPPPAEQ